MPHAFDEQVHLRLQQLIAQGAASDAGLDFGPSAAGGVHANAYTRAIAVQLAQLRNGAGELDATATDNSDLLEQDRMW